MQATGTRFQEWLRAQLAEHGWDEADAARELGVSTGTVTRWLMDEGEVTARRPSYPNFQRLSEVFGTDMDTLMDYAGVRDE